MICWHWHGSCCFCGYSWFLCCGGRRGRHRWIRFCCGQRLYRSIDIRWFSGSCVFNELTYNHYPFVNVWLSCCCRCCCEWCDIFTIRFWTGICGRRRWHFCVLLLLVVIRLFIIVNFRAQWKWIGFRIVIDGKWFIAGYFVRWWLHDDAPHWHWHQNFTLRLWRGSEREIERDRDRETQSWKKRHGILEKGWKQLVVSHYMMMMRSDAGTCCLFAFFYIVFRKRRSERIARWHVLLSVCVCVCW